MQRARGGEERCSGKPTRYTKVETYASGAFYDIFFFFVPPAKKRCSTCPRKTGVLKDEVSSLGRSVRGHTFHTTGIRALA